MTPGRLDPAVVSDRTSWIRTMLAGIRDLPLASFEDFTRERHHVAAAESYVRRSIEALVDLGRHILAKRFAVAVSEYKAIPPALADAGVLRKDRVQMRDTHRARLWTQDSDFEGMDDVEYRAHQGGSKAGG